MTKQVYHDQEHEVQTSPKLIEPLQPDVYIAHDFYHYGPLGLRLRQSEELGPGVFIKEVPPLLITITITVNTSLRLRGGHVYLGLVAL